MYIYSEGEREREKMYITHMGIYMYVYIYICIVHCALCSIGLHVNIADVHEMLLFVSAPHMFCKDITDRSPRSTTTTTHK